MPVPAQSTAEPQYDTKVIPQLRKRPQVAVWVPWTLTVCMTVVAVIFIKDDELQKHHVQELTVQMATLDQTIIQLRRDTVKLSFELNQLRTKGAASGRVVTLSAAGSDSPRAIAVSTWNNQLQRGMFVAQGLSALSPAQDYQLWLVDANQASPVSAGIIPLTPEGSARFEFKPKSPVASAQKLIVSEEPKGGSGAPTKVVLTGTVPSN